MSAKPLPWLAHTHASTTRKSLALLRRQTSFNPNLFPLPLTLPFLRSYKPNPLLRKKRQHTHLPHYLTNPNPGPVAVQTVATALPTQPSQAGLGLDQDYPELNWTTRTQPVKCRWQKPAYTHITYTHNPYAPLNITTTTTTTIYCCFCCFLLLLFFLLAQNYKKEKKGM